MRSALKALVRLTRENVSTNRLLARWRWSRMSDVNIEILLVSAIGGLIVGYSLSRALATLGVAAIFALSIPFSRVAREVTTVAAMKAAAKLVVHGIVLATAGWASSRWVDFNDLNPDSETFLLVGAIALVGNVVRLPRTLQLAFLRAWHPGFAEEYERTPLSKQQKLLREWTRLRLGERLPG